MSSRPTTGKLYKGSNFDKKTMAAFDKAKIMDLMVFYYYLLLENELYFCNFLYIYVYSLQTQLTVRMIRVI